MGESDRYFLGRFFRGEISGGSSGRPKQRDALVAEAIHAVSEHVDDLVDHVNVERGDWAGWRVGRTGEQAGGRRMSREGAAKRVKSGV